MKTYPRPIRRACRPALEVLELTPAGLNAVAASAARAWEQANAEYLDLAASAQEGASVLPEIWNGVGDRYHRAACLQEVCAVLLDAH